MFRLLGLLVVIAAILAGVGLYRGWFGVSTATDHSTVTVTVDKAKLQADEQAAKQKVGLTTRTNGTAP